MDQATALAVLASIFHNLLAAGPIVIPIFYTLAAASLLDLVTGAWAAWQSGTDVFKLAYLGEYVRSHVALKIVPIMTLILSGVMVGGTDSAAGLGILATAAASAGVYLTSTVASAAGNLSMGRSKTKGLPSGVPTPADK